jgi:hypothetical protein
MERFAETGKMTLRTALISLVLIHAAFGILDAVVPIQDAEAFGTMMREWLMRHT